MVLAKEHTVGFNPQIEQNVIFCRERDDWSSKQNTIIIIVCLTM